MNRTDVASRRRFLLGMIGVALLADCTPVALSLPPGTPARKIPRVGYLQIAWSVPSEPHPFLLAFRQGLQERGYVEGQNVIVEVRELDFGSEQHSALVTELLDLPVDVLVLGDSVWIPLAKQATTTIPLVMTISGDVVAQGLAASLARPGGNLTGLTNLSRELSAKRLELLHEAVPGLARAAVLWNPANPSAALQWRETQDAAAVLGIQLTSLTLESPQGATGAIEAAVAERAGALLVIQDPLTSSLRLPIVTLATENRLPTMFGVAEPVHSGGLMSYGPDRPAMYRRAAYYVDRILTGTNPADLPIEQPTTFELVINRKVAQDLGLAIPQALLVNATKVIG